MWWLVTIASVPLRPLTTLETTEIVDHPLLGPMDEAIWRQVKVGYLRYDLVRQTSPVTVGRYVNLIAFP